MGCHSYAVDVSTSILIATVITVGLALVFDFTNGFHDAANATSTVIATDSLTPKQAVLLSAVFNFLPAFVIGTAVANTIAKTVKADHVTTAVIFAALFGAVVQETTRHPRRSDS